MATFEQVREQLWYVTTNRGPVMVVADSAEQAKDYVISLGLVFEGVSESVYPALVANA
jgi:hypothetical protein